MKVLFACLLVGAAILAAQQAPSTDKPPVVRAITYRNMSPLTDTEVRNRFRQRAVRLAVERLYSAADVEQARTVLAELLTEHKVSYKEVRAETAPIPPIAVEVAFIVIR